MKYFILAYRERIDSIEDFPCVVLKRDSWDDFGFKTMFHLTFCKTKTNTQEIGTVKILMRGQRSGFTELDKSFECLSDTYCSLGQAASYYVKIKENSLSELLQDLNDVVFSDQIRDSFEREEGFQTSLLRSSKARVLLRDAREIFSPGTIDFSRQERNFSFEYSIFLPNSSEKTLLLFDFSYDQFLPYKVNVLIGRNGTGKSQILSNMALSLCGLHGENQEVGAVKPQEEEAIFGDVIVVSYSPFDSFKDESELNDGNITEANSQADFLPYAFCGIRRLVWPKKKKQKQGNKKREIVLKSHRQIKHELKMHYDKILKLNRLELLKEVLRDYLDSSFESHHPRDILTDFNHFSSGQKISVKLIFDLVSEVTKGAIVLFDEPESYLHPQAISSSFHCLQVIIDRLDAYAIVATHSPIIVQETPSKYVHILRRRGDRIKVMKPKVETLGQGLSSIIDEVFGLQTDDLNFFNTLDKFVIAGLSIDEVEERLGKNLDFSAKSYFLSRQEVRYE